MTDTVPAGRVSHADVPSSRQRPLIDVLDAHTSCIVHGAGELDFAIRNEVVSAMTAGQPPTMAVDPSGVTFMECGGSVTYDSAADDRDGLPIRHTLPGGVELIVRIIEADDVAAITGLYRRLAPEAVYRRFFTLGLPRASFFERLVTVADRGGLGLVAEVVTAPDSDQLGIVGEVEIEPLANGNGEIAIVVDQRWCGWLGSYLVELACGAAHRLGMANLEAEILACNQQMRAVTRHRGEAFLPTSNWKEVRVVFSTDGPAPSWSPGDRPRVLVEQQRGVAFDAVSGLAAAGYDVIRCAGRTAGRPLCPLQTDDTCPLAERADAVIVAMSAGPEREELLAVHRAHGSAVIVVEPGSDRLTGATLVSSAGSTLRAGQTSA